MNTLKAKVFFACILLVSIFFYQSVFSSDQTQQFLKSLGPDRGSKKLSSKSCSLKSKPVPISFESTKIIGVIKRVEVKKAEVKKALQDLKAEETKTRVKVKLSGDVLFDFDKWTIRPEARKRLKQIGEIIQAYKSPKVVISGHTDSKGSSLYNQKLSKKRAQSVRNYFVAHLGFKANLFETKGYGERRPIAPNKKPGGSDNPEGRQKNRRVEVVINK